MTPAERQELEDWARKIATDQPAGTMAMVAYVRDGQVTCEIPMCSIREFPTSDLTIAAQHISTVLTTFQHRELEKDLDPE